MDDNNNKEVACMNNILDFIETNKTQFALKRLVKTDNVRQETFDRLRDMDKLKNEAKVI